jgi:quercetin dioxygenase-like cupin family protein
MTNLEELAELPPKRIWDGVSGRIVQGRQVAIAVVELKPGAKVPRHAHDNEQLGLVITGSVTFTVGEETRRLGPGGTWRIPGGTPHDVRAGEAGAVVIDVFSPPRSDWDDLEIEPHRQPIWP